MPQALQAQALSQSGLALGLARVGIAVSQARSHIAEEARSLHPSAPCNRLQRNTARQGPPTNNRGISPQVFVRQTMFFYVNR